MSGASGIGGPVGKPLHIAELHRFRGRVFGLDNDFVDTECASRLQDSLDQRPR